MVTSAGGSTKSHTSVLSAYPVLYGRLTTSTALPSGPTTRTVAFAKLTRPALVAEALRLTRLLRRLRPGDPGATGLLALILLQDSRRDTRTDAVGSAVLLADQDRTRWDRDAIAAAVTARTTTA